MYLGTRAKAIERIRRYALWLAVIVVMLVFLGFEVLNQVRISEARTSINVLKHQVITQQQEIVKQNIRLTKDNNVIKNNKKVLANDAKIIVGLKKKSRLRSQRIKSLQTHNSQIFPERSRKALLSRANFSGYWEPFTATWYSPSGGADSGTITAMGAPVQDGWTVSVDPSVIPLGSLIEVKFGNGSTHVYEAEDTGGAIVGCHIDIFDNSQWNCIQNGVQSVEVKIISRG